MVFNQFPDYQSLEKGAKGAPAKANRSIPDRVDDYGLLKYLTKKSKVLDLGCNRGFFGTYLSTLIQSYVGCEGDANQLAHAQKKNNMRFILGEYQRVNESFDVILCLAFHSYVNISMSDFAKDLDLMCAEGGTIFIEGHPKGYRGEPEQHFDPLMDALLAKDFEVIDERNVVDRDLLRPFRILQRK